MILLNYASASKCGKLLVLVSSHQFVALTSALVQSWCVERLHTYSNSPLTYFHIALPFLATGSTFILNNS
eukprot:m.81258 g.81258  ORF g.81258 m.81258 type:complete len:70 (+) comp12627_c0_seq3:616-825(+)